MQWLLGLNGFTAAPHCPLYRDRESLLSKSDTPTVVLGMEVLDNLPHDKVRAKSRKKVEHAEIHQHPNGEYEEIFTPIQDPLITKVLNSVPSYQRTISPTWIPTVACGLLQHILAKRKQCAIVFADFDWLPPPDLDDRHSSSHPQRVSALAEGEPIVTDMQGNDHECYIQAPPRCDILFPTDFSQLACFVQHRRKDLEVVVQKQSSFLEQYGREHVQKTENWLTGYTPLLQDFANCSVLTVTSR